MALLMLKDNVEPLNSAPLYISKVITFDLQFIHERLLITFLHLYKEHLAESMFQYFLPVSSW